MRSDLLVYISGPMTAKDGRTIEQNVADGVAVFAELIRLGIPAFCPHLNGAYPSLFEIGHERWIAYDCAVLDRCTHILMMPRSTTSVGAMKELDYWLDTHPGSAATIAHSVEELCEMIGIER